MMQYSDYTDQHSCNTFFLVKRIWQLQEAKSRLSELVQSAQDRGAQTITRHGKPVAVIVSSQDYAGLQPRKKIVDVLRACPEPSLVIERLSDKPRPLKLDA